MSSTDNNIFIASVGDDGDGDGTGEPTFPPTPTSSLQRFTNSRKCDNAVEVSGGEELWGVAPVGFVYSVETNKQLPSGEAQEVLLESLSAAIVESIYDHECAAGPRLGDRQLRLSTGGERYLSASPRRRLGIQSILPGDRNQWRGECDASANNLINSTTDAITVSRNSGVGDTFCNEYDGSVTLGFDNVGERAYSFESVGDTVLGRIKEDMANGMYLDRVNQDLFSFNVTVARMDYIESDYFDLVRSGAFVAPDDGLTTFSKATIPIIAVLTLLVFCICWYAYASPARVLFKNLPKFGSKTDESIDEDALEAQERKRMPGIESSSYIEPELHDSSRRASSMDVPHWNRSECRSCQNSNPCELITGHSSLFQGCETYGIPAQDSALENLSGVKYEDYSDRSYAMALSCLTATCEPCFLLDSTEELYTGPDTTAPYSVRGHKSLKRNRSLEFPSAGSSALWTNHGSERPKCSSKEEARRISLVDSGFRRGRTRSYEGKKNFDSKSGYIKRQPSLGHPLNLPIEIGIKTRTLTDENGCIRQEMEL